MTTAWWSNRSSKAVATTTRQNAPILGRIVPHVTIANPRHFLLGYRLSVVQERSSRGPVYATVELSDGRRRSVRLTSTNLAAASTIPGPDLTELPRIRARMLVPVNPTEERLATAHRAKLAYVYARLVRQHQESTQLLYRLVDRALATPAWSSVPARNIVRAVLLKEGGPMLPRSRLCAGSATRASRSPPKSGYRWEPQQVVRRIGSAGSSAASLVRPS